MPAGFFGRVPSNPRGKLRAPDGSAAAVPARAFAEVAEVAASEKLQEGGPASGVDQLQDLGHPEQPNVRGAPPLLSPDVRRAHVRPAKLGVAQTPKMPLACDWPAVG